MRSFIYPLSLMGRAGLVSLEVSRNSFVLVIMVEVLEVGYNHEEGEDDTLVLKRHLVSVSEELSG